MPTWVVTYRKRSNYRYNVNWSCMIMAGTREKGREVLSDWSAEELEAVVYALEVEEAIPKVDRARHIYI